MAKRGGKTGASQLRGAPKGSGSNAGTKTNRSASGGGKGQGKSSMGR